ncbi:MAG TPA: hypothetical protein PK096_03125 [Candidatus Saccharibacteria bacterium]|nr:hypothetical protein [Candidatus Saccharibacteria bacterium]HRK94334.1 hypothetical protein [Candidatus Saccharibacteria bacterium]
MFKDSERTLHIKSGSTFVPDAEPSLPVRIQPESLRILGSNGLQTTVQCGDSVSVYTAAPQDSDPDIHDAHLIRTFQLIDY